MPLPVVVTFRESSQDVCPSSGLLSRLVVLPAKADGGYRSYGRPQLSLLTEARQAPASPFHPLSHLKDEES